LGNSNLYIHSCWSKKQFGEVKKPKFARIFFTCPNMTKLECAGIWHALVILVTFFQILAKFKAFQAKEACLCKKIFTGNFGL